LLVIEKNNYLM